MGAKPSRRALAPKQLPGNEATQQPAANPGHRLYIFCKTNVKLRDATLARWKATGDSRYFFRGFSFDYFYNILIVGDSTTGKTCCLYRMVFNNLFAPNVRPRDLDCKIDDLILDDVNIRLRIWDASAHIRHAMYKFPAQGVQGVMVLYDTTRWETFDNVQNYIDEIKHHAHPEAVVMLVGTKCDLSEEKEVDHATARNFADEHNLTFFEVSAKDGTNTKLAMLSLLAQIRQKHCELEPND